MHKLISTGKSDGPATEFQACRHSPIANILSGASNPHLGGTSKAMRHQTLTDKQEADDLSRTDCQ